MKTIDFYKNKFDRVNTKRELFVENWEKKDQELNKLGIRFSNIEKAQIFIQTIAKETQEGLKYHIEEVIQLALDSCFPGIYKFSINFELARGKTEARLIFKKNGFSIDPMNSNGRGFVNLVSLGLRIACWSLSRTEKILILDEPFDRLSSDLHLLVGKILQRLSEELGIQFIIVTHNKEFENIGDKVFYVSIDRVGEWDISKVEMIK